MSGNLLQGAAAIQLLCVVCDGLDAKYALAFGIDLESQLAAVQLEDRQIIRRSLNRDFPFRRPFLSCAIFRTALIAEDCL